MEGNATVPYVLPAADFAGEVDSAVQCGIVRRYDLTIFTPGGVHSEPEESNVEDILIVILKI